MNHCDACDIEGPDIYGPWLTSYEVLAAHRALHSFARQMFNLTVVPIYNKLFGGNH